MSKLGRFWDWLLPGLICLCPLGAMAYYTADAGIETPHREAASARPRVVLPERLRRAAAIHIARL